jgi:hypothetical protein
VYDKRLACSLIEVFTGLTAKVMWRLIGAFGRSCYQRGASRESEEACADREKRGACLTEQPE